MKKLLTSYSLMAFVALLPALGCDKKDGPNNQSPEGPSDASKQTPEEKAAEKKAKVDALLRANGIDPESVRSTAPSDSKPEGKAPAATNAKATTQGPSVAAMAAETKSQSKIDVLNPGSGDRKVLRYQFKKDRTRKFSMDMEILPKRIVNGQPVPGMPAIRIAMSGTSKTTSVNGSTVQRENTFLDFTPTAEGAPPAMLAQMQAQFSALKGIQLIETVSTEGQVLDMQIKQGSMNNPQVLALMQNLQDGMSNAFLPLPKEPVGVGAKWKGITTVQTAGLTIVQENSVHLTSLKGSIATVELTFQQSAEKQLLDAPGLPPGAKAELVSMEGGGTGKMTVDLANLITDSKINLHMKVDTKISGPGMPGPVNSVTDTAMKIHMRVTE